MGDLIMAKVVCEKCGTAYKYEVVKDMKTCPVCGVSLFTEDDSVDKSETQGEEEHPDWITWYYYQDEETKCFTLRDEPIDLEKWTDTKLIKEFKAPPRDSTGSSERAKEILRTYIPDAFVYKQESEDKVRCPYCRSTEIQLVPRKFSLLTGFATNKFDRMCVRCKKRF